MQIKQKLLVWAGYLTLLRSRSSGRTCFRRFGRFGGSDIDGFFLIGIRVGTGIGAVEVFLCIRFGFHGRNRTQVPFQVFPRSSFSFGRIDQRGSGRIDGERRLSLQVFDQRHGPVCIKRELEGEGLQLGSEKAFQVTTCTSFYTKRQGALEPPR